MKNLTKIAGALALASAVAMPAQAGTIDLFDLAGNFDQGDFGATGSEYYAQSVTADDINWADLSFRLTDDEGGSFKLIIAEGRAAGLPGSGFAPDADAVLFDSILLHSGSGQEQFDFDLDLGVNVGDTYFFVLQGFGETIEEAAVRATQFTGPSDQYTGGEFIFSNDNAGFSNTLNWSSRFGANEDLAFRAVFDGNGNQVPAPPAIALLLGGLAMLGAARRMA